MREGDTVLGYDETTQTTGAYSITALLIHDDPVVLDVTIDGETITTTPEHPFYVRGMGWVPAGDLEPGAAIRMASGTWGQVQTSIARNAPQTMYNLTVAEAHTFFVGDAQWLVHNACSGRLDRALKGTVGDRLQAHHVIPGELESHPLVGRAINAGWDIDGASNGILLPDNLPKSIQDQLPLHNTNHPTYTRMVESRLNDLEILAAQHGWSDARIIQELDNLAGNLRTYLRSLGGGVRVPK